jgi:hypothetical protein
MKILLLVTALSVTIPGTAFGEQAKKSRTATAMAVAYVDEERLSGPEHAAELQNFRYFVPRIEEVVKRDFPGIEFKIARRGELVRLPDGTRLNVQNVEPAVGVILGMRGKKRRLLSGVQTEADFACAAASYFKRSSPACPK